MAVTTLANFMLPLPNLFCKSDHLACKNLQAIAPPVGVLEIASKTSIISGVGNDVTNESSLFCSQASFVTPRALNNSRRSSRLSRSLRSEM